MKEKLLEINQMLVEIYDDINYIEEYSIKHGTFNDISITEIHTITAVGLYCSKTMSEIAATLDITMGTLTIAVDKLIKKGYLERNRSSTDRRIVNVSLTKRGKLVYRIHEKFHLDMVQSIMNDFSPDEEEILLSALSKLNKHLKDIYFNE
jgi:DNA-binding MarR family transcriptional regulator